MAEPTAASLALGRIFRLMSRPAQQGDAELYEAARRAFLASCGRELEPERPVHCWARDRTKGAAGD